MIDLILKNNNKNISNCSKGSLLLELLVAISVIAIILSFSANALFLSMRGSKTSGDRDTASTLATEAIEAVRSSVEEDYQNIYGLTKGAYYHPVISGNKWTINNTGSEQIVMNGVTYTRYVVINNVSRDSNTRNIQSVYTGADDDPSTQNVNVTVSWPDGNPVLISEYFSRWKNKVCDQPSWTAAVPGNTVINCGDTTFDSKDSVISITGGTLKLQ